MNQQNTSDRTINYEEIHNFDRMAAEWWDESGPFKPLHQLNPTRIQYIRDVILSHFSLPHHGRMPFTDLSVLDLGCGGGLVCEPLARLGGNVTGVDAGAKTVEVARRHAAQMGLSIDYRVASSSDLVDEGCLFDVVLALEIVEHVADVSLFIQECARLVRPGGCLILSTINRTWKSYAMAILGAEYVLRWVPRGTHQWDKFLTPAELAEHVRHQGLDLKSIQGMEFNPLQWSWSLGSDLDVNYLMYAAKPD
jgi:2-polyprenyl-6-hydroxyphenyl methylase / 3-demethylubiquinone-9 3-methyltransferase